MTSYSFLKHTWTNQCLESCCTHPACWKAELDLRRQVVLNEYGYYNYNDSDNIFTSNNNNIYGNTNGCKYDARAECIVQMDGKLKYWVENKIKVNEQMLAGLRWTRFRKVTLSSITVKPLSITRLILRSRPIEYHGRFHSWLPGRFYDYGLEVRTLSGLTNWVFHSGYKHHKTHTGVFYHHIIVLSTFRLYHFTFSLRVFVYKPVGCMLVGVTRCCIKNVPEYDI